MTGSDQPTAGARPGTAVRSPHGAVADRIRDHLDAVYRYARRRLSAADAEDVAQESFVALFRARAAGREPEDAGAYLLATARNRVADLFRRRAIAPPTVVLPDGWEAFCEAPMAPDALEREELRDLVHVALGLLAAADRAALLARYRQGLSVAEIAGRDGGTEKAVEMRLRRAREAFRLRFLEVGRDWIAAGEATT